jgi:hypothetical protein
MSEQIMAKCCEFGRRAVEWNENLGDWAIQVKAANLLYSATLAKPECPFCGSKLEKSLPPVTVKATVKEIEEIRDYADRLKNDIELGDILIRQRHTDGSWKPSKVGGTNHKLAEFILSRIPQEQK